MSNIGNHSLSIGWLVPAVEPGQGGLRNIFRICRQLSNFGHNITAYCEPSSAADTDQSLAELIHTHYGPLNFAVRAGQPREQLFDVLVATFWRTARNVLTYPYTTGRAYLVQDFEPYFYPMGDDYLAAESTYKFGLNIVTSGPWCAAKLKADYCVDADSFTFPVDHSAYYDMRAQRNPKQIAFFARPEMPRRCFALGCAALELVATVRPDIEVTLFGSSHPISTALRFRHRNLGVLSIPALSKLYNTSSVGIAFSTTNPSLVPYEMMACGLPVIDLDLPGADASYGGRNAAALARATPQDIADTILKLLASPDEQAARSEEGTKLARAMMTEEQVARVVEQVCARACGNSSVIASVDILQQASQHNVLRATQPTWHHYNALKKVSSALPSESIHTRLRAGDLLTLSISPNLRPIACIDLHVAKLGLQSNTHFLINLGSRDTVTDGFFIKLPLDYCSSPSWIRLHVPESFQDVAEAMEVQVTFLSKTYDAYIDLSSSLIPRSDSHLSMHIISDGARSKVDVAYTLYSIDNSVAHRQIAPAFTILPSDSQSYAPALFDQQDALASELRNITNALITISAHLRVFSKLYPIFKSIYVSTNTVLIVVRNRFLRFF
jgi:glycosyltransferase involved in cell wall biosynthesis